MIIQKNKNTSLKVDDIILQVEMKQMKVVKSVQKLTLSNHSHAHSVHVIEDTCTCTCLRNCMCLKLHAYTIPFWPAYTIFISNLRRSSFDESICQPLSGRSD